MSKKSKKTSILDWWQAILDETKELVDDRIDCLRDKDDDDNKLATDIEELKRAIAEMNIKLDSRTVPQSAARAARSSG